MTKRVLPDPETLHAWLAEWVDAHNAHDIDRLICLVDNGVIWVDPALFGQELVGKDAFREMLKLSFRAFPDLHVIQGEPLRSADVSRIAVPWELRGTFTGDLARPKNGPGKPPPALAPTGRRVNLRGIDLYEFEGDLLIRCEAFCDMFTLSVQLGLLPDPNGRLVRLASRGQRLGAALLRQRSLR